MHIMSFMDQLNAGLASNKPLHMAFVRKSNRIIKQVDAKGYYIVVSWSYFMTYFSIK